MEKKVHLLEIYDADGWQGPNPLKVTGLYTVHGPESCDYYVVAPVEPVCDSNGAPIHQLALRTHYDRDGIQRAMDSTCTVGITLARDGHRYEPDQRYGFTDFLFWKVGKIQPCAGGAD